MPSKFPKRKLFVITSEVPAVWAGYFASEMNTC